MSLSILFSFPPFIESKDKKRRRASLGVEPVKMGHTSAMTKHEEEKSILAVIGRAYLKPTKVNSQSSNSDVKTHKVG